MSPIHCRFAPSTTGQAHPGTLLAALLAWLDARQHQAHFILRLENLDPDRCKKVYEQDMLDALHWLGIDWDHLEYQNQFGDRCAAAMDQLADAGRLYACNCSRKDIRALGRQAPDGSWRYPGTCRHKSLNKHEWRACPDAIRASLDDAYISIADESGIDLSQNPYLEMGDPLLKRKDGSYSYQLAVVVDDAASSIGRIIRGRDLIASTAVQVALQELLGLPRPTYRHHLLLLEKQNTKLAKYHHSVGWDEIKKHYQPQAFIGNISRVLQLGSQQDCSAHDLIDVFNWQTMEQGDRVVHVTDHQLQWPGA